MNDELIQILGDCLEAVEAGTLTLLDCVEQHPEHREELIPLLEGAHYMKMWATAKPSVTFQAVARERLLRKLPQRKPLVPKEPTRQEKLQHWVAATFGWLWQPTQRTTTATVFAAFICLFGLTLLFSNRALPGEPLYPLKTTVEQVRLGVSSEARQQQLELEYSQRRLTEIETLLVNGQTETAVFAAQARLPETAVDGSSLYLHLADEHLRLATEQAGHGNVETASSSIQSYARNMAVVIMTFEGETIADPEARLATLETSLETQTQLIEESGFEVDETLATELRIVLEEAAMIVENGVTPLEMQPEPMPLSDTPIITPTVTITTTATVTPTVTQPDDAPVETTPQPETSAPNAPASPEAAGTNEPEATVTSVSEEEEVAEEETPVTDEESDGTATPTPTEEIADEPEPTAEPPDGSPIPVDEEEE